MKKLVIYSHCKSFISNLDHVENMELKYQFCGTVNQLTATEVSKETTTNYKIEEKK